MEDRAYLSIGEVLSLLKEEFPDVTISKIRFLESQGLLDPERTPSGYRKFYETDVERLRWILRQQREHFLPLKVIKGRLRGGGDGHAADEVEHQRVAEVAAAVAAIVPPEEETPLVVHDSGTSMTLAELAAASGLQEDDLRDLERFGLLGGRKVASSTYYDEQALEVAGLAAGFMKFGVEARHLRMYKTAGEREAGFFEQIVMPMLKQRNPQARQLATDTLSELSRLGNGLRQAMLRQALRTYIEGK
ncbi:MAG TPA: MerR family transcriptional regulator [Acidimicrobiales bacterium]|nr:MerR family transcriptional regulator [Acidimicrobiales bacterium]